MKSGGWGGCLLAVGAWMSLGTALHWFTWETKMTLRQFDDDPVGGMYGPAFLLLYGTVIVTIIILCRGWPHGSANHAHTATSAVVVCGASARR